MSVAPPIAPVLGRIQAITARFEPSAPTAASERAASVAAALAARSAGFEAVLGDALGSDAASVLGSTGSGLGSLGAGAAGTSGLGDLSTLLGALTGTGGRGTIDLRGPAPTTVPDGNDVVAAATRYVGVPYQWGGTDPATGLDCSGFVQRAFADVGIQLPRVSYDQARVGRAVPSIDLARPGDLVAFGEPVDHIAIYVGDNKIIQAPRRGEDVGVSQIERPITAIRRVVAEPALGVPASGGTPTASVAGPGTASSTGPISAAEVAAAVPGSARFADLFVAVGARHGVDPRLLAAVAKAESGFDPAATSRVGAQGLMQIMPATARSLGVDPRDPAQAVDGAARYLRTQLRDFGSVDLALAAYNAGPGAVRRFGGIPPYAETRSYVTKITALLQGATSSRPLIGV